MILSDKQIRARIDSDELIKGHLEENIKHCGCELTIGAAIEPHTGKMLLPSATRRRRGPDSKTVVLEPADTMIVITGETLKIPKDLCATYGQLNRWANQGVMILNTSIVEPGYEGRLRCLLVNFSSQRVPLALGKAIAKLNFHQVLGAPTYLYRNNLTNEAYLQSACEGALMLPKSLLDISGVEERVTKKVGSEVRKGVILGGVIIAFLLLWSQLEGFWSNWIYARTGVMSTTKQVEVLLEKQKVDLEKENQELRRQLGDVQDEIRELRAPKGATGGKRSR